ncbi:Swt1 family HEPN domain-containing protein [Gordonia sp. LSe1-13]|uniref:Swt1 family HEPN domain-containing protein n=1 Tax=Gordonia sesuvii TaxID=3116777 RepID=A0ABU7MFA3_9ACTN|nr:Swt1 family HEPN domain-containing protein [Gordonia sp. LSe1-13]
MTFKPNLSVKEGLDHLAKRLDPIINARFAGDLGEHPWTVVLEILDEKKGYFAGRKYWVHDLQAQLRMLTERLGDFGYPFDDKLRTVSTLGNELRIVRNQLAHMHDFSIEEAFRANDFSVRLLMHFDDEGLDDAKQIRHEALAALASAEGVTVQTAAEEAVTLATVTFVEESNADVDETEAEVVTPDPSVLVREPSVIGDKRLIFEPWTVVRVGDVDVLDDLPKKIAKEKVRAAAVEIATYEGPIHLDRLVQMTAKSFGLQRVRASRLRKLTYHVQQAGLFVDSDRFVWPREIDPGSWREFRPNDSSVDRPFVHVSPVEIANAARLIRKRREELSEDDLAVAVLQTFGRSRRTKQVVAHLSKAMSQLIEGP